MNYTRFLGPSENYSPLHILKELDKLLLQNNWTRVGVDPATLDSYYASIRSSSDTTRRTGAFGYKHGTSGEVLWFNFYGHWYRSGANYESIFGLFWSLQPTFSTATPENMSHLSASYSDNSHTNETADWHIGATPDGFYVMQGIGDRPGGLSVERFADGRWLALQMDTQYRWGDRSGYASVYPITGGWDGWHQSGLEGMVVKLDSGKCTRLGTATILELGLVKDYTNGTAMTTDGSVQRGYWFQVNNNTPLTSSHIMRFFEPGTNMSLTVGNELRIYRRLSNITSTGSSMGYFSWRVQ